MKEETTKRLLTLVTVDQEVAEPWFMSRPKIKLGAGGGSFPQPAMTNVDVTIEKSATYIFKCI